MANLIPPPRLDATSALFVDVDGTLLEIAPRPEAVHVPADLPDFLKQLANRHRGAFALISGRSIATLDQLFRPWHGAAAGLHGGERRRADGSRDDVATAAAAAGLGRIRSAAAGFAAGHPGVRLEDKGHAVALHFRAAPDQEPEVVRFAERAVAESRQDLRLFGGKMVVELVPCGFGKGRAIAAFLAEPPFRGGLPVFVGDDMTDEEGFAEITRRHGVAIRVGPAEAETAAAYTLPDVAAALAWLRGETQG